MSPQKKTAATSTLVDLLKAAGVVLGCYISITTHNDGVIKERVDENLKQTTENLDGFQRMVDEHFDQVTMRIDTAAQHLRAELDAIKHRKYFPL